MVGSRSLGIVVASLIAGSPFVALSACSSDYTTSGDGVGAGRDARVADPGSDGGMVDPPVDGGAASTDARVDFCAVDAGPGTLACTAFDLSTSFPFMWAPDQKKAGSLDVDSKDSRSPPNSLVAVVPAQLSGSAYQELGISTPQGTGSFAVELDFLVSLDLAATGASGLTSFVCFVEISAANGENAQICFGKSYFGATIETYDADGGAPGSAHVNLNGAPPKLDAWHHLSAAFSFLPSGGAIAVAVDGAELGATTPTRTLHLNSMGTGDVLVEIGASSAGQVGQATVRVDNFRLSAR